MLKIWKNNQEDLAELYHTKKWSEGFHNFIYKECKQLKRRTKSITLLVQKLIKLRNEILIASSQYRNIFQESASFNSYSKKDFSNILDLVDHFKDSKFVSPHYLYDLPKKDPTEELYKDNELSE